MISNAENAQSLKRPHTRLLARVYPLKNPLYPFIVRIGCFDDQRQRHCRSREEADAVAETLNATESRLAYFRKFFPTEKEAAAFLRIRLSKLKLAKPKESSLTPPPAAMTRNYMPTTPCRVKPYRNAARPTLKFVVRTKENGKYTKRFFAAKAEADAYASARNIEVRNQGVEAMQIPSWLRMMAMSWQGKLDAHGKTLADACAFYLQHLEEAKRSCTLSALIAELMESKRAQGLSRTYLNSLRANYRKFMAVVGADTLATEVTPQHVRAFLATMDGQEAISKNAYLIRLHTLFNFAIQNGRATVNPARKVPMFKAVDKPIGILTPDELIRILEAASKTELLPFYAIGAFAGLRVAELFRLDWEEIDLESNLIEVTAKKSKTAMRRLVKIQPALRELLLPYAGRKGKVVHIQRTLNHHETYNVTLQIRRDADAMVSEAERGPGFRSLEMDWPTNALRHSFASYHLAHFKDAAALALEMGHTTTAMIFKHYREVVKPAAAALYWSMRLKTAHGEKVVALPLPNTTPSVEGSQRKSAMAK
jgi:integrase